MLLKNPLVPDRCSIFYSKNFPPRAHQGHRGPIMPNSEATYFTQCLSFDFCSTELKSASLSKCSVRTNQGGRKNLNKSLFEDGFQHYGRWLLYMSAWSIPDLMFYSLHDTITRYTFSHNITRSKTCFDPKFCRLLYMLLATCCPKLFYPCTLKTALRHYHVLS